MRIGIIAGEASGDLLGARLMRALKRHLPDVHFEGIGGSEMQAEGCNSLFPMERLSVLGLTEILGRYFELRRLRKHLIAHLSPAPRISSSAWIHRDSISAWKNNYAAQVLRLFTM